MDDTSSSQAQRPRRLVEHALAAAIDRIGPVLFFDPDRLRSILRQATTEAPKEIEVLVAALGEEVPQHLLAANGDEEIHALLPRLVQKVAKNGSVERGPATWAVRTWAHALALPTTGLDAAARAAPPPAPEPIDLAAIVRPRGDPASRRPPVPVPTPTPPAVAVPVVRTPSPPAVAIPATPVAKTPPGPAPVAPVVSAPAITPVPPAPITRAIDPAEALSDFVPLDEPAPVVAPTVVPPSRVVRAPDVVATEPVVDADAARVAAERTKREPTFEAAPLAPPMRELRPPAATRPGLFRARNLALAAAILVVIVAAIGYALWPWSAPTTATASSATGKVAIAPVPSPEKPTIAEPTSASAPPPAPQPTPVAATPTPTAPASSTPLEDALRTQAPVPAKAAPAAASTAPLASDAPAPTITRIDVPAAVIGKPFSIALAVDGDPRRVASIERRVVESDATWPVETTTSPVGPLARTKSGGFMIPFRPLDRASTSVLQFVAIDRAGARGPARRATLKVANEAPVAATAATTANAPAATDGTCTPATCGSVVSSREIELRTGAASFEMIVRMDDREIQNVVQSTALAIGTRVRVSGGRVTTIDR